jgi:hypothetical protein
MVEFEVDRDDIIPGYAWPASPALPENSIALARTPFTLHDINWDDFFLRCKKLKQQVSSPSYVFVNATWDPMQINNQELSQRRLELQEIFSESKVIVLTAQASHYYDDLPGVMYFPFFTLADYGTLQFKPRQGRFGCLNRRAALHRIRLMYQVLEQKLLDPSKDVYSINFANLSGSSYNLGGSDLTHLMPILEQWPGQIATHPDKFPNDYSIDHPAWHTGIAIITETAPGDNTIISEKTGKGIASQSCFSIYMADVGYRVLEDLGFEPRFFTSHAEYDNIEPLLKIIKEIETPSQALDYRWQHIKQIEHNFSWFNLDQPNFLKRPWYARYEPKLKSVLESL